VLPDGGIACLYERGDKHAYETLTFARFSRDWLTSAAGAIDIGSRLELLVDDHLIDRLAGKAELRLHHPQPRNIALVTDRPWEGNAVNYVTVFRDGDVYRMYYRGANELYTKDGYRSTHREVYCYAESKDGVKWTRPNLGLFEFNGSKKNNIVWDGLGGHNFTPFKDANPAATPESRYKALGYGDTKAGRGLYAFRSADGIRWSLLHNKPVITKGAFDSQNVAFWDGVRKEYREYHRDFRNGRDIRTSTSKDFLSWTEPSFLEYTPRRVSELYTNQVMPYYRAPHLFLGFPTRYVDRGWSESARVLPRPRYRKLRGAKSPREGTALTDGMLMTSRDGRHFRVWPESFIRPGLRRKDNWFYGDNYQNWGLVETKSAIGDAPNELSNYVTERTMQDRPGVLRRHTLRIDGFVSAWAPLSGGELRTRPLRFTGKKLVLNCATSAVGTIRVEVQDEVGKPLEGFSLTDCAEIYGDSLERTVTWKGNVAGLAGKPVRLRFELKDADPYSFHFHDS
jgi:hypothetical protein